MSNKKKKDLRMWKLEDLKGNMWIIKNKALRRL